MTETKENQIAPENFLICPDCQGIGVKKIGLPCSTCGGIGVGIIYNNHFFYWLPKISFGFIELNRLRKKANQIINIIVFLFGLSGFMALFFWVYQTSNYAIDVNNFAFWKFQDSLLLLFWLSVFADFFIIYRISREVLKSQSVKIFKYNTSSATEQFNNWNELKSKKSDKIIDVSGALSEESWTIIENAFLLANRVSHKNVSPLHLFFESLANNKVAALFSRLDVNGQLLVEKISKHLADKPTDGSSTVFSVNLKMALINAYLESSKLNQKKIQPIGMLSSCIRYEPVLKEILLDLEIDENKINNVVIWFLVNEKQIRDYKKFRSLAKFKPASSMDRAYTAVATPVLNSFAYDLTLDAKWNRLEYCVSREAEINKVWESIESGAKGILLVGPEGVGKKTLIAGIAQKMVEEDVPRLFLDKRLVELDAARLISGVDASQAEGRMMMIVNEVSRAGNIILFLNNIENIMGITSGLEGSMDLSGVLGNALERQIIFAFSSTSSENYRKYVEGKGIDLIMSKIEIGEPKADQAIQIIESKISSLEGRHGVYFSYSAIEQSVFLSNKYMHDSYLPDKALKILESAAVKKSKAKEEFLLISKEDVAIVVSDITDIPVTKISEEEGKNLLDLENKIHKRMISQEPAVKMVSESLRRARVDLREGIRPIASFLFLGPTGVGKTELAKTVSDVFFGDEKFMIRIDMSEYQHPDSIMNMIGDASGTKGHLTESVRKSPFSLILLDEIEKAHPDILNIFLQVMDDGRLTDGQGRLIDFTNSIIIATSNVGATFIQDELYKGTDMEIIKKSLINTHLNKVMRPELINRFDGIIVFEPLSLNNVIDITRLMLKKISELLDSKGIELRIDDAGLRLLAKMGFDPKFGARPLRRLLQDKIENQIANKILSGELKRRDTVFINEAAQVIVEKAKEI
jgi:ATP-dependent Clp protease ATP-binding subunit ClpC